MTQREKIMQIIRDVDATKNNCFEKAVDAIMDEIEHEGKIKIADGWVDPKSTTPVWYVATDLSRMDELPARSRTFANLSRNFLSRDNAEAFLKSERERTHWGQVQIGNGVWIDENSQQYWIVWSCGKIEHGTGLRIQDFQKHTDKGKQAYATLAEAEAKSAEIHKSLGHYKTADGEWVDPKCDYVYFVGGGKGGGCKVYAWYPCWGNIDMTRTYSDPHKAMDAMLKIQKESR